MAPMSTHVVSASQVVFGLWKFVLASRPDGTKVLRFLDAVGCDDPHSSMYDKDADEKPVSAGLVGVKSDRWTIQDGYSMTLALGVTEEAEEMISGALGLPWSFD